MGTNLIAPTKADLEYAQKNGLPKPKYHPQTAADVAQRKARDAQMLLLALRGNTYTTIAKKLGVTNAVITRRLPTLLDRHMKESAHLIMREVPIQLGMTQSLIEEVWAEWEKSKGMIGKRTVHRRTRGLTTEGKGPDGKKTTKSTPTGEYVESERTEAAQGIGDARLAAELRHLMDRRLMLLGLQNDDRRREVVNNVFIGAGIAPNGDNTQAIGPSYSPAELAEIGAVMKQLGISATGTGYLPLQSAKAEDAEEEEPVGRKYAGLTAVETVESGE